MIRSLVLGLELLPTLLILIVMMNLGQFHTGRTAAPTQLSSNHLELCPMMHPTSGRICPKSDGI